MISVDSSVIPDFPSVKSHCSVIPDFPSVESLTCGDSRFPFCEITLNHPESPWITLNQPKITLNHTEIMLNQTEWFRVVTLVLKGNPTVNSWDFSWITSINSLVGVFRKNHTRVSVGFPIKSWAEHPPLGKKVKGSIVITTGCPQKKGDPCLKGLKGHQRMTKDNSKVRWKIQEISFSLSTKSSHFCEKMAEKIKIKHGYPP